MTKLIFNILIAISFIVGVYLPGKKSTKAPSPALLKSTTVGKGKSARMIILTANPANDTDKELSKGPLRKNNSLQ